MKFRGFTLIELIVVMGILAILATIVVIAVNPGRQFAASRNAKRASDTRAIAQALNQHAADNNGQPYASITTTPQTIGTGALNLASILVPNYLSAIPNDPQDGTAVDTKYKVFLNSDNKIVVTASTIELNRQVNSEGVGNYALQFDGINDSVTVPHSATLDVTGTLSVSAWIKTSASGNNYRFVQKNGNGYSLYLLTSNRFAFGRDAGFVAATSGAYNDNAWHHVVGTYDNSGSFSGLKLYIDGVQATVGPAGTFTGFTAATSPLVMGAGSSGFNIAATVDEVSIYNRVLTASEVQSLYNDKRSSVLSGAVGVWHFDEGGGTSTVDASGNNFTGTLTNGPLWITGP